MTRNDWQINIENLATNIAKKYGSDVAASVFRRYNSTCFDDLNSTHYEEIFGELLMMDEDD